MFVLAVFPIAVVGAAVHANAVTTHLVLPPLCHLPGYPFGHKVITSDFIRAWNSHPSLPLIPRSVYHLLLNSSFLFKRIVDINPELGQLVQICYSLTVFVEGERLLRVYYFKAVRN